MASYILKKNFLIIKRKHLYLCLFVFVLVMKQASKEFNPEYIYEYINSF